MSRDRVEYYGGDKLICRLASSIVPAVGQVISIRKETWEVVSVTYAIDYPDAAFSDRETRANVDLRRFKEA